MPTETGIDRSLAAAADDRLHAAVAELARSRPLEVCVTTFFSTYNGWC